MNHANKIISVGVGIAIFGFSMYSIASSISIPFLDSPVQLTPLEELKFNFSNFGIKFFPVGLLGLGILLVGIILKYRKKLSTDTSFK